MGDRQSNGTAAMRAAALQEKGEKLRRFATTGDTAALSTLLADPDIADFIEKTNPADGVTALHFAARAQHADCVSLLLAAGCNKEARTPSSADPTKHGRSALHYGARAGSVPVLEVLLRAGCSVEGRCKEHKTALHYAAAIGSQPAVAVLLEGRADPDAIDIDRKTALHWAAEAKDPKCLQFLLAKVCAHSQAAPRPYGCQWVPTRRTHACLASAEHLRSCQSLLSLTIS